MRWKFRQSSSPVAPDWCWATAFCFPVHLPGGNRCNAARKTVWKSPSDYCLIFIAAGFLESFVTRYTRNAGCFWACWLFLARSHLSDFILSHILLIWTKGKKWTWLNKLIFAKPAISVSTDWNIQLCPPEYQNSGDTFGYCNGISGGFVGFHRILDAECNRFSNIRIRFSDYYAALLPLYLIAMLLSIFIPAWFTHTQCCISNAVSTSSKRAMCSIMPAAICWKQPLHRCFLLCFWWLPLWCLFYRFYILNCCHFYISLFLMKIKVFLSPYPPVLKWFPVTGGTLLGWSFCSAWLFICSPSRFPCRKFWWAFSLNSTLQKMKISKCIDWFRHFGRFTNLAGYLIFSFSILGLFSSISAWWNRRSSRTASPHRFHRPIRRTRWRIATGGDRFNASPGDKE